MVRFSFLALKFVKLLSPRRKSGALLGKLMKALADEYGSGKSAMNPKRFTATLNDRSNTGISLDIRRLRPARSIRTKQ